MFNKCVVDLGGYRGQDTLMYLTQGYYVYTIEANPLLAEAIIQSIPEQYKNNYQVLNLGISDKIEESNFYINHYPQWSSFDKTIGSRKAHWQKNQPVGLDSVIKLQTTTLETLYKRYVMKKFNSIEYLKIDIEGNDFPVVKSLENTNIRPKYISCEFSDINMLNKMKNLGYTKFKLVNQKNIQGSIVSLTTVDGATIPYRLSRSASGPFGKDIKDWIGFEEATVTINNLYQPIGDWYDLHCSF